MALKICFAFLCTICFLGSIGAYLVYVTGQENCNSESWREEIYMYVFHQRRLALCLDSHGEFRVGLEIMVAKWMSCTTMLAKAKPVLALIFSVITVWMLTSKVYDMLTKKRHTIAFATLTNSGEVDISFHEPTVRELMRMGSIRDVEIQFDHNAIRRDFERGGSVVELFIDF
ncbi:hypothetical protein ScPMuIL_013310 [Solemya velum]